MCTIQIPYYGYTFDFEPGKSLLELLLDAKIFIENPCNGNGVCGKCKVRIIQGDVRKVSPAEAEFLDEDEIISGVRLSCQLFPKNNLKIEIPQTEDMHSILVDGYIPDFDKDPSIKKQTILLREPSFSKNKTFKDQLTNQLQNTQMPPDTISSSLHEGTFTAVIHEKINGERILIALEEGNTLMHTYGVAIDIGTTTVAASLIDLTAGYELNTASVINPQKDYGTDVLTRIAYEIEHPENGVSLLQSSITDAVNNIIESLCQKSSVAKEQVYEISVAANCTMLHMLLGIDATSIGRAPYKPVFVNAKNIRAADIGIYAANNARLYCLPSVSSFIGADIVAGTYVCGLHKAEENIFFIDIGTNGEMVFSDHGKLISCSCAAGPALEGMNISSGMRAAKGAIEDINITKKSVELKVIGNIEPTGICGSGILAAIKELLHAKLLRKEGAFIDPAKLSDNDFRSSIILKENKKKKFILQEKPTTITITQKDIRQVQLAKGAILSGFYAMLKKANKSISQLDKVIIAGQFGSHLPPENITGAGLLPKEVESKLVYVGNSSKSGAVMALLSKTARKEMETLAEYMDYLELGTTKNYQQLFAKCMAFPAANEEL